MVVVVVGSELSSLVPDFVLTKGGLISTCLTRGADFEAYTGPMEVAQGANADQYLVNMVGSSTTKDLQRDTMQLSALNDMTNIPDNLTILMNHDQTIPDSVFGGLYGRPWLKSQNGIVDFNFSAEVETSNPKAMQTYSMIARGRRLGCSVGCLVLDYDYDKATDSLIIKSVLVIEYSVVGVPAQQRCWVEVATKSLFERALIDGYADKALQLAPAVRGMYTKSYNALVKYVENTSLRNDLEHVRPRDTAQYRVMCSFDDKVGFVLADSTGIIKSLTRNEVSTLIEQKDLRSIARREALDTEDLATKTVTGKTSWPLASLDTEWTGSKAEDDIFSWAGGDDFSPAKAKQGFLYQDPDEDPKTKKAYKMPFCYTGDGGLKIVPLGVRSCANVLNGGMGGVHASSEDQAGMKAKCKTLFGRINRELKPDPEWIVPWEKKDSAGDLTEKDGDGVLSTENGGETLVRQDLGEKSRDDDEEDEVKGMNEKLKKAADVSVSSDGTHEACTGDHTHAHKAMGDQGSDDQHKHSHTHNGDSDHDHSHAEKSAEDIVDKQASADSLDTSVPSNEQSQDDATQGAPVKVLTEETSDASQENVAEPVETEEGQSETNQKQAPAGVETATLTPEEILRSLDEDAPVLQAKLELWNDIAKGMGLPDANWEAVKHYLAKKRTGEEIHPGALWEELLTLSGRTISDKSGKVLEQVHEALFGSAGLYPAACPAGSSQDDDTDGDNDQNDDDTNDQKSLQFGKTLTLSVDLDATKQAMQQVITDSMVGVTATIQQTIASLLESVQAQMVPLLEQQKSIKADLTRAKAEQTVLTEQVVRLGNMSMGRPTQQIIRGMAQGAPKTGNPADGAPGQAASFQEMLAAIGNVNPGAGTLKDLEALTQLKEKRVYSNGQEALMQYRHWPAGVGNPVGEEVLARPALTQNQKMYMLPHEWEMYNAGLTVDVPTLDDPFHS